MQAYGWTDGWRECAKLELFESWLELQTSPIFQLHRFSDDLVEILERGAYGTGTTRVKAVLVTPGMRTRDNVVWGDANDRKTVNGPADCIAVKVPSTPEIRRAAGLLVQAFTEHAAPVGVPSPVQPDLLDPLLAVPEGQPPARVAGLYMTERLRVLSITPYHVRLVATGDIVRAYGWGLRDHKNPGGGAAPPEDDVDALAELIR